MEYKDYYQVLGVPKSATQEEIKKTFRRLARKYHPDFNKGNVSAENQFKEINEAYQVLSDPEKRRKYDQLGANWDKYQDFQGSPFDFGAPRDFSRMRGGEPGRGRAGGFSDFFKTFFGGFDLFDQAEETAGKSRFRTSRQAERARESTATLQITLAQAVTGAMTRVSLRTDETCPECGGHGAAATRFCVNCLGQGTVSRTEEIKVRIPAGVGNGSRIRLRNKGRPNPATGVPGDLYLVVQVQDEAQFQLRDRNIHTEVALSLYEALLGAEIDVPTITGRVRMRIPPETQPESTFRLKGKGLPALGASPAGDQIVKVRIVLPTQLTGREKELLRELAALRPEHARE